MSSILETREFNIVNLPRPIIGEIARFLPLKYLNNLMRTCKYIKDTIDGSSVLWKEFLNRRIVKIEGFFPFSPLLPSSPKESFKLVFMSMPSKSLKCIKVFFKDFQTCFRHRLDSMPELYINSQFECFFVPSSARLSSKLIYEDSEINDGIQKIREGGFVSFKPFLYKQPAGKNAVGVKLMLSNNLANTEMITVQDWGQLESNYIDEKFSVPIATEDPVSQIPDMQTLINLQTIIKKMLGKLFQVTKETA